MNPSYTIRLMDEKPSEPTPRVFGISKDGWTLIGQLVGLLALAAALVGLQSLL